MDVRGKDQTGRAVTHLHMWIARWMVAVALLWTLLPGASYAQLALLPAQAPAADRTGVPLQPMDTLFVVEVAVPSRAELRRLQRMGHACGGLGTCRLEVNGGELSALKQAGLQATVVEQAVVFSTQQAAPALLAEQRVYGENLTDYVIPDKTGGTPGNVASPITISGAPSGSVVTKILVSCRVAHTWPGDLEINVGHGSPDTYVTLWNRQGGPDDAGLDDDGPTDDDVELYERWDDTHFDGDWVNQTWYLDVYDHAIDDTGTIDWFKLWVYFCPTVEAPTLDSPVHNSVLCDTTPLLQWNVVSGADDYQLQVDNDSGFGSPEVDITILAFNYQLTTPLPIGEYWWRVKAHDDCGWGGWSASWKFSITGLPTAPTLVSPPNVTHTCDTTPSFDWTDVGNAWGYRIEVDNDASFAAPEIVGLPLVSEYTPVTPLPPGQYYWRVLATNTCGDSAWSGVGNFVIDDVPAAPTLSLPADDHHTCDHTPVCEWSAVSGATLYQIQVDDNASFTSPEFDAQVSVPNREVDMLTPGEYHWRVRASNDCGNGPWSDVWDFSVEPLLPVAPTLVSPGNASHTCSGMPTFQWAALGAATSYRIQIDNDPSFASPEDDATTSSTSHTPASSLMPGTWHWRVRASNFCGNSPWSGAWSVTIDAAPTAPSLLSPPNTAQTCDPRPLFEWQVDLAATGYRIQVDDEPSFSSPEIDASGEEPGYRPSSGLPPGTYHWRVRASNACGDSPWSGHWTLTIDAYADPPVLFSPADGSVTCDTTPEFDWDVSIGAASYRIQVDNDISFPSPEIDATTFDLSYIAPSPLPLGAYFWRVSAINLCGDGPWSAPFEFVIGSTPGAAASPSPADGASGVATNANLDWADAADATSYDVYFGTASTPPFVANVPSSDYDLPALSTSTRYFWQIVAKNDCAETPGPTWSYTTTASTNHPPENFNLWPDHGGRPAGRRVNFTATHRDADGWRDLKQVYLHIGSGTAKRSACRLRYDVRQDRMYMLDNTGKNWLGGFAPGAAKVIRNQQCTLSCAKSTVVRSGRVVKVQWNLVFRTSFRGVKNSYMHSVDMQGAKTAWEKMGTYRVK